MEGVRLGHCLFRGCLFSQWPVEPDSPIEDIIPLCKGHRSAFKDSPEHEAWLLQHAKEQHGLAALSLVAWLEWAERELQRG